MKPFDEFMKNKDKEYGSYYNFENKYNIILLTNTGRYSHNRYFRQACKELGVNFFIVDNDNSIISEDGTFYIESKSGNEVVKHVFDTSNTVAIFRHYDIDKTKIIRNLLAASDIVCCNNLSVRRLCDSKYKCVQELKHNDIATTNSILIKPDVYQDRNLQNAEDLRRYVQSRGIEFPVLIKLSKGGSKGFGTMKCDTIESLCSSLQYVITKEERGVMIQEAIDSDYELKVHVLCTSFDPNNAADSDYKIIGAIKRMNAKSDFRPDYSNDNDIKIEITERQKELAIEATKALGGIWCCVNIGYDKKNKHNYVIDVDAHPDLEGVKLNPEYKSMPAYIIVKYAIDYLDNKKSIANSHKKNMIAAYSEKIYLHGFGELVASMDTGNSSSTSMRVSEMEINTKENEVTFKFAGKEFKKEIVDEILIRSAGGKEPMHRPVVLFDIDFMGTTYKNCKVNLNHMPGYKCKVPYLLISRSLIHRFGIKGVCPDRTNKFILTGGKSDD